MDNFKFLLWFRRKTSFKTTEFQFLAGSTTQVAFSYLVLSYNSTHVKHPFWGCYLLSLPYIEPHIPSLPAWLLLPDVLNFPGLKIENSPFWVQVVLCISQQAYIWVTDIWVRGSYNPWTHFHHMGGRLNIAQVGLNPNHLKKPLHPVTVQTPYPFHSYCWFSGLPCWASIS